MKTYGKFEAIKELYQTPAGSVWSARPLRGGGPANCCIKLIGGGNAMFGPADAGAVRGFLAAAALQQKVAADAEAWAPIYDFGPIPSAPGAEDGGAFYVSKLYPRSAQRLIDTSAKLSAAELRAILQGVVKALREMRADIGRPHGNLKPANVLLADRPGRRGAAVVLSDPDPFPQPAASLTKLPDVKAMGALLFALVTARPYMIARWPVPMSADWDRLGSTGPQWVQLCNNLLNTRGAADEISLEMIAARIEAIRPTRPKLARRWVAAAAIVILGACAFAQRARLAPYLHTDRWADLPHAAATQLAALNHTAFASLFPPPHKRRAATLPSALDPLAAKQSTAQPATPIPAPPVVLTKPVPLPLPPPPLPAHQPAVAALPASPPPAPAPIVAPAPPPPRPIVVVTPPPPLLSRPNPDAAARQQWIARVRTEQAPSTLPPAAAAAFTQMRDDFLNQLSGSHEALDSQKQRWAEEMARVRQLDSVFPAVPAPDAQQSWQMKLAELALQRREQAMAAAVGGGGGTGGDADAADKFRTFVAAVQRLFADGGDVDRALNGGDVPANGKVAAAALTSLDGDPDAKAAAAPLAAELSQLAAARSADDRAALLVIVTDRRAIPGVRVAAWQRLDRAATAPQSLADVAASRAAAATLADTLDGLGNPAGKLNVLTAAHRQQDAFFASLNAPPAVASALLADSTASPPIPPAQCPPWFQYDLVLWRMQHSSGAVPSSEIDKLAVLAANVDDASAHRLAAALASPPAAAPGPAAFEHAGPATMGWTLRSHHGAMPYDSITYLPPVRDESQNQALEFLRVPAADSASAASYLCTTLASVAMVQQTLNPDVHAVRSFRNLGPADASDAAAPGAHIWTYSGDGDAIVLDDASYRTYFHQAPSASLPAQFVTPQMSLYLARLLGCRLPSSTEWRAALAGAAASHDPSRRGFATQGWKLRDSLFAQMVRRNASDADAPPLDDGIFPPPTASAVGASVWTAAAVKALGGLGGQTLGETPDYPGFDGADDLVDNKSAAFRQVGSFAGVFHDLVGNVAEFVLDEPPGAAEKLSVRTGAMQDEQVRAWFTAARLGEVRVVGGSALSPPAIDPLQPLPLPAGDRVAFSDVGFRLAFSDPTAPHDTLREAIAAAPLVTATSAAAGRPVGVADTP